MPRIKTFYDELGVPRDANAAAIKHAFKEIAKVYHPDKNPDKQEWAHEQMSRFNFIVETLLNPDTRREYDDLVQKYESAPPQPARPRRRPHQENAIEREYAQVSVEIMNLAGKYSNCRLKNDDRRHHRQRCGHHASVRVPGAYEYLRGLSDYLRIYLFFSPSSAVSCSSSAFPIISGAANTAAVSTNSNSAALISASACTRPTSRIKSSNKEFRNYSETVSWNLDAYFKPCFEFLSQLSRSS